MPKKFPPSAEPVTRLTFIREVVGSNFIWSTPIVLTYSLVQCPCQIIVTI